MARLLDAGTLTSGACYLVTKQAGTSDLAAHVRDHQKLSIRRAVDYTIQIIGAIAEAHSHGIVHANLCSTHVRLDRAVDGAGKVKVTGFGVMAHWAFDMLEARCDPALGTLSLADAWPYMAPEQIRHRGELGQRADIWSVGALLHEMLAGKAPFQERSPAALLASIAADPRLRSRHSGMTCLGNSSRFSCAASLRRRARIILPS